MVKWMKMLLKWSFGSVSSSGSNFFELETSVALIKNLKEEVVYAKLTYIVYYLSSECKTDVHKTFPW